MAKSLLSDFHAGGGWSYLPPISRLRLLCLRRDPLELRERYCFPHANASSLAAPIFHPWASLKLGLQPAKESSDVSEKPPPPLLDAPQIRR